MLKQLRFVNSFSLRPNPLCMYELKISACIFDVFWHSQVCKNDGICPHFKLYYILRNKNDANLTVSTNKSCVRCRNKHLTFMYMVETVKLARQDF